ncbi:MAG: 16S rRNA (guanine(527)-N(7))-methyltransferase RsmG [Candidatus Latescibacteria bacterium]|nr:16S rRNA (guanine(527)-N(7))-methyltransferase RsmG [Candidatus Latescibacterota bacterium]
MIDYQKFYDDLKNGASFFGLTLSDSQIQEFFYYYRLLLQWNSQVNLISKSDIVRFIDYHILDSLKVVSVFDLKNVNTLFDFGSGAGIPGIPISLCFSDISSLLVDSRTKRCKFLNEVVLLLSLHNVCVLKSRIETIPESYNEMYDVVVTRATVSLDKFFLLGSRFLSPKGSMISIKGECIDNEISALKNILNQKLFSFEIKSPINVLNVRTGTIIIITRK